MALWQVQEAKQRFSEVLRRAHDEGPQVVTRHGEQVAVVLDMSEYRHLTGRQDDGFKQLLFSAPLYELEIVRSEEPTRVIDFVEER